MPGSLHCFDQFRTNLQSEAILVFSIVEIFQFTNYLFRALSHPLFIEKRPRS